jgi:AcrR family transcriptional regulator
MKKPTVPAPEKETTTILLDTAESLFSEYGFVETTVRQIAQKAKVNQASINYHFRSKRGLFNAVFERRASTLLNERVQMLRQARQEADEQPIALRAILRAFIYPPLRMAREDEGGRSFVKLQARLHNEPKEIEQELRARLYNSVSLQFFEELANTLPQLSREVIAWRLVFVMGLYQYVLLDTGRLEAISADRCNSSDLDRALLEILDFCEQGFLASSQ